MVLLSPCLFSGSLENHVPPVELPDSGVCTPLVEGSAVLPDFYVSCEGRGEGVPTDPVHHVRARQNLSPM